MDATRRRERSLSDAPAIAAWSPDDGVRRVLVVAAHPDDVDFGTAGTVAAFTKAGVEVTYCVVTNGDAGEAGGQGTTGCGRARGHQVEERQRVRSGQGVAAQDPRRRQRGDHEEDHDHL